MAIAMDALNQIALILRSDQSLVDRLRPLLSRICALPEYTEWQEKGQYDGRRFRLPSRFISPATAERRFLESLRLVIDDVLEVKLNLVNEGLVFMTDGLFVPADFRVFPWRDESDTLMRKLREERWQGWPTAVIDPATGCGHNALRANVTQRVGLDVSARALSFAAVNALLNERTFAALALSDTASSIPFVLDRDAERTLFIVNMPFALEPITGALVRTAAGGENGYEKTVSALKSINDYAKRVLPQSEVGAIVLTYSIGNVKEDRWVVLEEGRRIFGKDNVQWELLADQKLWRINGKKEQPNPMPLSSLRLKADCQYYVRDPRMRDPLRAGYIEKERSLRNQGYDALAYAAMSIVIPSPV